MIGNTHRDILSPDNGFINGNNETSNRRWVLIYSLIILSLTTLPYLIGYSNEGDNWRYTGFVFGVEDGNSYIAKMAIGESGAWLFRTPYTAYPQNGVLAFLPYILLGKLSADPGSHLQLVSLFHIYRWLAGITMILATYEFISFFIGEERLRRWGVILVTVGGGLGWILILLGKDQWFGSLPLDFYSPETFGFLSIYGIPHLLLARAGLLWGIVFFLRAANNVNPSPIKDGLLVGIFWLITALAQPLTAVIFGVVLGLYILSTGAWQLWREYKDLPTKWRRWHKIAYLGVWSAILPLPFLIYNVIAFSLDPFLKAWTSQNIISSPHLLHYLVAYGLYLPLAIYGGIQMVREKPWVAWLPVSWVSVLPLLAYAPYNLQRRLPEGIWVALITLSLYSFTYSNTTTSEENSGGFQGQPAGLRRCSTLLIACLFMLTIPSTIFLLVGGFLVVNNVGLPLYRPVDETLVFEYLAQAGEPWAVVLSSYDTGNALPAWAPMRVVIGHGPESIGLKELNRQVDGFYDHELTDAQRLGLISEFDIKYIFWGPNEQMLGDWIPEHAEFLEIATQNGDFALYVVRLLGEN